VEIAAGALIVPRRVRVNLAGHTYFIPALPAARWMVVLLEKGWEAVVPGMLEGDLDALWNLIMESDDGLAECEKASQDAITAAAGCPWWSAVRLLHSAAADAGVMGELRSTGADLNVLPLGAVLATLYRIYTRDKEPKDVAKVDHELDRLPPGVSAVEARYDPAAAADSFERQFAARGGR
jgi:hypothetical protein